MYFMYVDESGDPGFEGHPSPHFVLSAFLVPIANWRHVHHNLLEIRRLIKSRFGFPIRAELKGAGLVNPGRVRPDVRRFYHQIGKRNKRIALYRLYFDELTARLAEMEVYTFSIYVNKKAVQEQYHQQQDVFRLAWERLLDRFNTFLRRADPPTYGLVISDMTDNRKARSILRRMRYYHPVDNPTYGRYQALVHQVVEDPFFVDSAHSFFLQTADLVAHAVYRYRHPKHKRYRVPDLYRRL